MFLETANFVANYLLSRRPRALTPYRADLEMPFVSSKSRIALHSLYSSRRGLQDYWVSPQRRYPVGSTWRTPSQRLLILPGNTGVSEVESVHWPSCCQYKHKLVWKNRWQHLDYYYLGKRARHFRLSTIHL